jgi:nucleotide-binding universal stress UspA family protein
MTAPRSILVALDGSPSAESALGAALDIARLTGGSLTLMAVSPLPVFYGGSFGPVGQAIEASLEYFRGVLEAAKKRAEGAGVPSVKTVLREGAVVDQLVAHIEESRPDLVVMGARGLSTSQRLLLGSISEGVLHHTSRSVLIVRTPTVHSPPESGPAIPPSD